MSEIETLLAVHVERAAAVEAAYQAYREAMRLEQEAWRAVAVAAEWNRATAPTEELKECG